jgi:hypothetical protein
LVLYLNRLRGARGYIGSSFVRRVATRGWRLYGLCLAFTVGAGLVFLAVLGAVVHLGLFATGIPMRSPVWGMVYPGQHYFAYYSVILSFLLIHYYFDHFLFLYVDPKITPRFAQLASQEA